MPEVGRSLTRSLRSRIGGLRRRAPRAVATDEGTPAAPEELDELFHSIGVNRDYADLDLEGLVSNFDPLGEPDQDVFELLIRTVRPRIVIEVGTWTGGSLLHMFELSQSLGCQPRFIAVDTWLGSNPEFWFNDVERERLHLVGGYPTMFRQFVVNILTHGATEEIFPLPTSTAAARVLRRLGIVADAIYIDGGHEEEEVKADVELYYDLLRPGGVLLGDDYHSRWPGVVRAVDDFAATRRIEVSLLGAKRSKWWLTKP